MKRGRLRRLLNKIGELALLFEKLIAGVAGLGAQKSPKRKRASPRPLSLHYTSFYCHMVLRSLLNKTGDCLHWA